MRELFEARGDLPEGLEEFLVRIMCLEGLP